MAAGKKAKSVAAAARFWLMKTEPETFSFETLVASPGRTSSWEGVRNYQARNLMRDEFKVGDQCFIYHSSCAEPGIFGLAEVVRAAHPDLTALDETSPYFDAKSARDGSSRWCMVSVQATAWFSYPVLLRDMRARAELAGLMVLQRGARLSVQPVAAGHARVLLRLGKPQTI